MEKERTVADQVAVIERLTRRVETSEEQIGLLREQLEQVFSSAPAALSCVSSTRLRSVTLSHGALESNPTKLRHPTRVVAKALYSIWIGKAFVYKHGWVLVSRVIGSVVERAQRSYISMNVSSLTSWN